MTDREKSGLMIAAACRVIRKDDGSWLVPSERGNGKYVVRQDGDALRCSCPDHELRGRDCKHIYAVRLVARREASEDAKPKAAPPVRAIPVESAKRPTYSRHWPSYNESQVNEQDHFQCLLRDLCAGVETPAREGRTGRPSLPLADALFAVAFKVYSGFSGRRFVSDLRDAHARGLISRLPHYNSVFNYLENPDLAPVLHRLIAETGKPLSAVECDFAADSSGFSASRFTRWFDVKYGCVRNDRDWVKAHIMTGVRTNVITAVEIHGRLAGDAPLLPALLETTAKTFRMAEVSADKGYSSIANVEAIASHGAMPYIAFKAGHSGKGGGLWEKMFHFFCLHRDEFLASYHKRSNVESTFSMVKGKFGDGVRSKTDVAMGNEVLLKFLCHNLCCLIRAFHVLGVTPTFWNAA